MSNQNNDSTARMLQAIAMLSTIRSAAGTPESQIHTSEDIRVRARLARATWLNLTLAGLAALAGISLHLVGWIRALGVDLAFRLSLLGAAAYLLLLVLPAGALAVKTRWPFVRTYLWAIGATYLLSSLVLIAISPIDDNWSVALGFAGLVLVATSLPFFYNQWKDLTDPYWRESPHEKAIQRDIFPYIGQMFQSGEVPPAEHHVLEVRYSNGSYLTDSDKLLGDPDRLGQFAYELVEADWDLTESRWGTDRALFASYADYRGARAVMERQHLIRKINPGAANSPYEPTPRGRAAFRRLAEAYRQGETAHTRTHTHA
jgi:hypothetical protein